MSMAGTIHPPTDREGMWKGFGALPEASWVAPSRATPALPRGVRASSVASPSNERAHPYVARLLRGSRTISLRVPARTRVREPLVLDRSTLGRCAISLVVGRGAHVDLLEELTGPMLGSTSVRLEAGATLTWRMTARLGAGVLAVHHRTLSLAASSSATLHVDLSGCGRLALTETQTLVGADANVSSGARVQIDGDGRFAHDVRQEIAAPRGKTRLAVRAVVGGRARTTFRGVLHMTRDAQGADGAQSHRALLLSNQAVNDATPALEILADDVRCTHAATTARLDDEQRFYLLARGLPATEAEAMLVDAFLSQA